MSDHSSSSSLPTSPVTNLPELPYIKQQARRTGPGSIFSETTEGYGDYTTNLPFTFSSASLALAAVPQEWSSAKHGFHGPLLHPHVFII
jgi:vacuolar protein sorting-associated protein 54